MTFLLSEVRETVWELSPGRLRKRRAAHGYGGKHCGRGPVRLEALPFIVVLLLLIACTACALTLLTLNG